MNPIILIGNADPDIFSFIVQGASLVLPNPRFETVRHVHANAGQSVG
ncbi:hypothetical protein [Microvirga lotononidis]|uniref:Uncharacterized protein n=1 Tax=Microvirga lotononidis TaxID=864069 RepID=I4YSG5_9HYPH|nr:hypothetical protein [Microvirga lotononidis]EIM26907.1 hypothetical protein MicloDRAFT_00034580 [Microvirga lotononidis]WQO31458.1 hypothetical protein U0023_34825 [Microvirga lotononidis]